uniref:Uncharacterized protein n=1 Tax=Glossina austeni TaxID=7395 RepID=A0A1A9UJJ8_GLOAU
MKPQEKPILQYIGNIQVYTRFHKNHSSLLYINVKQLSFLNIRKYASNCDITENSCEKVYEQRPVI